MFLYLLICFVFDTASGTNNVPLTVDDAMAFVDMVRMKIFVFKIIGIKK